GDKQVKVAVVVVVQKRAARVVADAILSEVRAVGYILKPAACMVAVKTIRAPISDEEIRVAVVVKITGADTLAPSRRFQTGCFRHIAELATAFVVIQPVAAPWA